MKAILFNSPPSCNLVQSKASSSTAPRRKHARFRSSNPLGWACHFLFFRKAALPACIPSRVFIFTRGRSALWLGPKREVLNLHKASARWPGFYFWRVKEKELHSMRSFVQPHYFLCSVYVRVHTHSCMAAHVYISVQMRVELFIEVHLLCCETSYCQSRPCCFCTYTCLWEAGTVGWEEKNHERTCRRLCFAIIRQDYFWRARCGDSLCKK